MTHDSLQGIRATTGETDQALFHQLAKGRLDIVVATRLTGMQIIKTGQLDGIHVLEPPLVTLNLYHYLHQKHAHLVPRLTEVLEEMAHRGRLKDIREKQIKSLLVQPN